MVDSKNDFSIASFKCHMESRDENIYQHRSGNTESKHNLNKSPRVQNKKTVKLDEPPGKRKLSKSMIKKNYINQD